MKPVIRMIAVGYGILILLPMAFNAAVLWAPGSDEWGFAFVAVAALRTTMVILTVLFCYGVGRGIRHLAVHEHDRTAFNYSVLLAGVLGSLVPWFLI